MSRLIDADIICDIEGGREKGEAGQPTSHSSQPVAADLGGPELPAPFS